MSISEQEVRIRRMTEADLSGMRTIDQLIVGEGRALSWPLRAETQWAVHHPALSFIAEAKDRMVGFLLGDIRGAEYGIDINGWIDMIGIREDYWHRGIGRSLVEAFQNECKRKNARMRINVRDNDKELKEFLVGLGFVKSEIATYRKSP